MPLTSISRSYFSFLLQQVDIRMEEIELLRLLNFVQLFLAIIYQRTESDEEKKLLESFKVCLSPLNHSASSFALPTTLLAT